MPSHKADRLSTREARVTPSQEGRYLFDEFLGITGPHERTRPIDGIDRKPRLCWWLSHCDRSDSFDLCILGLNYGDAGDLR